MQRVWPIPGCFSLEMRGKKRKEKKERDETKFPWESWILVSMLVEILEDRFEMEIIYSIRIVYL